MATVDYQGQKRFVCGYARYPEPPEPGTIVGPKDITREMLVVLGQDEAGFTLVGYATVPDLKAARDRMAASEAPRSLTEMRWAPAFTTRGGA